MAPGPIIATDTAFSSNRFASAHQIPKLHLQVELKETVVSQLHAKDVKYVEIKGGSHGIPRTRAEEINAALAGFLA